MPWFTEPPKKAFEGSTGTPILDTKLGRINKVGRWHLQLYGRGKQMLCEVVGHMDLIMAINYIPYFQSLAHEPPQERSHSVAVDTSAYRFLSNTKLTECTA
jgi:hypothetical protein